MCLRWETMAGMMITMLMVVAMMDVLTVIVQMAVATRDLDGKPP